MAVFENIKTVTFNTGEDLSAKQYHFVKLSSGEVVLCDASGEDAVGVLLNEPDDDQAATIALIEGGGKCKVVAGATISQDDYICTGADGKAAVADTDTEYVLGTALEGGSSGNVITVLLNKLTGTQT